MVRETRYLWIGNLPGKITEEKISERFSGHGKIQSVKLLQAQGGESCNAIVAFMDIKSASKAHNSENIIDGVVVETRYSEPGATISHRVPVSVTRTQHEPGIHSTVTAVKKDASSTTGTVAFSSQRNVTGRFANKQEGYSDDKSVSSRSSFDASFEQKGEDGDHFTERGRSKQRYYPGSRGFTGKYDSGSQSHDQGQGHNKHQSLRQTCSSACSEPSTQRQHGPGQGSRSFQGSSRSRSGSRSSSSGSISSTGRSRSPSRDRTAERKKTLASAVSQPQQKDTGQQSSSSLSQYTGILIRGFPVRSTDTSIRDGLFHEYKKYGKVTSVSIIDNGTEPRHAVVSFKKPEDAKKAMETTNNKVFFGSKITVIPHKGFNTDDVRFRPPEAEQDEYHHKATRTLFVGNLEMDITKEELREIFKKYGYIIDIDIKKQGTQASYAFVQYDDIKSVVQALRDMDGETIGSSKVKLGFGKSMPTNCVWLDNVSPTVSEKALCMSFCRYGPVTYEVIDREQCKALIYYDCLDIAQRAVNEMRGRALGGKKIQIDFASVDCQTLFFDNLERQGVIRPGDRPDEKGRIFQGQYPQGFEGRRFSYQKGRGSFGRGRGFQHGRRGYYDRNFDGSFERRSGSRYYDDFGDSDTYGNDSYEQELREYYSQREREQPATSTSSEKRRDSRADSPYSKSSRFTSPTDRYDERYENYSEHFRDTDSHSGDRESVRSFRSESRKEYKDRPSAYADHYPERFSEDADSKTGRDRPRGISPASSDYSYRSKSPAYYRCSHSPSPVSIREHKVKERTHRAQSPTTPTLDEYEYGSQTESSVDIHSGKRDGRAKKLSKRREFSDKDDSEERTSSKLSSRIISHVSSLDSDKHLRLYHSKEDLMDIDKSSSSYDKHWKSTEEPPERQKVIDAFQTMRERKLEKQRSRSASSSGSRNKHHDIETHKDMFLLKDSFKVKSDKFSHPANVLDHSEHTVGSKVVKMDKKLDGQSTAERRNERTHKSDSEHESGGDTGPGSDVSQLEHLKLELMKELSQLEDDTGRMSANEDEEGLLRIKKHKRPRLEEVFDLDIISDPSISMKKWRDKVLPAEFVVKQEQAASVAEMNKTDSVSSVQELRKMCRPLDRSKFKPVDTTQGFRKQMESIQKQEKEHLTAKSSASKAKQETVSSSVNNIEKDDDPFELTVGDKSPEHVPTEFIPKKRRKVVESVAVEDFLLKGHRKYRIKRSEECASSGEEGDDGISQKHGILHRQSEHEAMDILDSKGEGSGVKCDAGKMKLAHDGLHARIGSKDHKTNPRIERQGSGSVFHRDRGPSEPPIIPDSPIEFSDGKSEKRIPQEPRTIRDGMKREASDLPLPRFARQFNCGVLSSPKQSPKSHVSPKGSLQSPQMSPALPKLSSPPFSPGIHSPQTSPAIKQDSQMVLPPQMVPPPAPGDFPLLSLSSLSGSASTAMANVTSTLETTSPPQPPPPPPLHATTSVTVSPQSLTSSAVSSPLTLLSPVTQVATTTAKSTGSEPSGKDDMDISADTSPASSSPPSLHVSQLTKRDSPHGSLGSTEHKEVPVTQGSSPTSAEGKDDLAKDSSNTAEGVHSCATDSVESPTGFALSKIPPKLDLSGSDLSDRGSPTSPGRLSLEDRIRALDEKLAQTAKPAVSSSMQPSASVPSSTPSGGASDYRGKYRVRKKDNYSSSLGLTPLSTMTLAEQKTSEPSDFVRSILAKSSIFDQDSKRLSGSYDTLDTNQEGHLNLKEAPLQQRVGLNKSSGDGLIMYDDNAHDGLSRFLSSSSLVRQSSAPDSLAQYGISSRLSNKLSPPPPPPPTPSSLANAATANTPHSSAGFTYVSAVSVSPHDPRTANSVGPSAGSLLGGSSPLLLPSLSRSGSVDSGLLLHGSSAGSRLVMINRRSSVEQIKVSSSYGLAASSVLVSQCGGPPDLNKVGQYGKDQPQPLPCVSSSPTNSLPASVLMPPPALKMIGSDGLSRLDSIKRDHLPAGSNREFLDPPVLKQEPKELDLTSVMKHENSTDYSLKRKADGCLTTDSLHTSSPSKVEPILDSHLTGEGLVQKMGSLEPEHKKLKLTTTSSSLFSATSEKKSEKKLDSLTKSHSSKDIKKHVMKASCNNSSVSNVPSSKISEKKTEKTDAKDLQRSDKTLTSCGKRHIDKTKSHLSSFPGSSSKGNTASSSSSSSSLLTPSSSKLEHSKSENKLPSDKSKSHSKEKPNKKDSLDKVNKEHRSSEKKDSKPKPSSSSTSSSSSSSNKGSSDGKHRVTKDMSAEEGKTKHQDRTVGGDKANSTDKHRPQKSDAKHDSNEKTKADKVETSSEKTGMKKIEKQSASGVKKVESLLKLDDKNKNDKASSDKPKDRKERHRSGDSLPKSTKQNKCHGSEKQGSDDKVKEKKVPEEKKLPAQENSSSSDKKKSTQERPKTDSKSKPESKDKNKSTTKDKQKDCPKNKEAKKSAKSKTNGSIDHGSSSNKTKDKRDEKSPAPRKRDKSGSHSEEVRSDPNTINQEELEMLAPFLSMYELVKTRSHLGSKDTRRNLWNSKRNQSDDTESSVVNSDDESSTYLSGTETKLTRRKASTDSKPQEKSNYILDSSTEDDIGQKGSNKKVKKNKLKPKEKKASWVSADESSSDSDSSSGSGDYLKFLASQQKDNNRHKNMSTVRNRAKKPIPIHQYTDTEEEKGQNAENTSSERHSQKKQASHKSPKTVRKPAVYTSSSSDSDSGSDLAANSSKTKLKAVSKEKKSLAKSSNTSMPSAKKVDSARLSSAAAEETNDNKTKTVKKKPKTKKDDKKEMKAIEKTEKTRVDDKKDGYIPSSDEVKKTKTKRKLDIQPSSHMSEEKSKKRVDLTQSGNVSEDKPKKKTDVTQSSGAVEDRQRSKTDVSSVNNTNEEVTVVDKEMKTQEPSKPKEKEEDPDMKSKKTKKKSDKNNEHPDKNDKSTEKKKKKKVYRSEHSEGKPKTSVLTETVFQKTMVDDQQVVLESPQFEMQCDFKFDVKAEPSLGQEQPKDNAQSEKDAAVGMDDINDGAGDKLSNKPQRQSPIVIEDDENDNGIISKCIRPDNIFDLMEKSATKDAADVDKHELISVKEEAESKQADMQTVGHENLDKVNKKETSEAKMKTEHRKEDLKQEGEKQEQQRKEEARRKFLERQKHEAERRKKEEERRDEKRRQEEKKLLEEKNKQEEREMRHEEECRKDEERRALQAQRMEEERRQKHEEEVQEQENRRIEERKKQEQAKQEEVRKEKVKALEEKQRQEEARKKHEEELRKEEERQHLEEVRKKEELKRQQEEEKQKQERLEAEKHKQAQKDAEEKRNMEKLEEKSQGEELEWFKCEEKELVKKQIQEKQKMEKERIALEKKEKQREELDIKARRAQQTASAVASIQDFSGNPSCSTEIGSIVEVPQVAAITNEESLCKPENQEPLKVETTPKSDEIEEAAAATRVLLQEELGFSGTDQNTAEVEIRTAPTEDQIVEVVETMTLEPVPTEHVEEQIVGETTIEPSAVVTEVHKVTGEVDFDKMEEMVNFSPDSSDGQLMISQESTSDYDIGSSLVIDTQEQTDNSNKANDLADDIPKFSAIFNSVDSSNDPTDSYDNKLTCEDQKENKQLIPKSESPDEIPEMIMAKGKSRATDIPANVEHLKANQFQVDIKTSLSNVNIDPLASVQFPSKGGQRRGRGARGGRGGRKTVEERKTISSPVESGEYHLDAKTGFLSTFTQVKELDHSAVKDAREITTLTAKGSNFDKFEKDDHLSMPPLVRGSQELCKGVETKDPIIQDAVQAFQCKNEVPQDMVPSSQLESPEHDALNTNMLDCAQEQKDIRTRRMKAKKIRSDIRGENDTSPKTSSKQGVPPHYELPVLRRRSEQTSTVGHPSNADVSGTSEKFSSRGRKIIPKERGDEVTCITRKIRRSGSGSREELEPRGRGRRGGLGQVVTPEPEVGGRSKKTRKMSLRSNADEDGIVSDQKDSVKPDDVCTVEPEIDNADTPETKSSKRRRSQRRLGTVKDDTEQGDREYDELEDETLKEDSQPNEGSPKIKRGRKPKGRKPEGQVLVMSPRAQSPRSKSIEAGATSPKASDKSKPFVKLEKLNIEETIRREEMKKDEDEHSVHSYRGDNGGKPKQIKDLYEWQDEDEPIPEYTHVCIRKRNESPRKPSGEKADEPAVAQKKESIANFTAEPEETKPLQSTKAEALKDPVQKACETRRSSTDSVSEKTFDVPSVEKVDTSSSEMKTAPEPVREPPQDKPKEEKIEHSGRHLPLKLEMKKEAARAEAEAAVAAAEAEAAAKKLAGSSGADQSQSSASVTMATTPVTPSWVSNMDKVIEQVAKGNFERGESFDFYKKTTTKPKRGRNKNKEEQLSPRLDSVNMSPVEGHQLHIDTQTMPVMPPGITPLSLALSISMNQAMASPIVSQAKLTPAPPQQARNGISDVVTSSLKTPVIQTPVSTAIPSPVHSTMTHNAAGQPVDGKNPVHALMRASYRVSADGTDNRPVGKGKSNNDGLIKTPPATLAGQSAAVHVGVVSSQAYSVNQRGDIPQGQTIEKVPNPHVQLSGQSGISDSGNHIAFSSQGRADQHSSNASERRDSQSSRPDSCSGRPDSCSGWPEGLPHTARPESHPGHPDSYPSRPESHPALAINPAMPVNPNIVGAAVPGFIGGQGEAFIPRTQPLAGLHPAPDGFQVRMMQPQSMVARQQETAVKGVNSHGQTPQHSPSLPKEGIQQPNAHFAPPLPPHIQGHPFMSFPIMMSPGVPQVSQPSPPMSQASELRAALAQPSKLIKQEQMMQRVQQCPTSSQSQAIDNHLQAAPQDSRHSPSIPGLGQHRMPFTFQEPRSAVVSRAEPKNQQGQNPSSHVAPTYTNSVQMPQSSSSAFSQPDIRMPMPGDIRPGLTHPDARPGIPQQMYPPGLQAGMGFPSTMGLPPGIVLPGPQHEYLTQMNAHPGLPALVPPPTLLAQQSGATPSEHHPGSRPPSRRTSSPSQLSPRVATPHQAPTPNPQGAAQPIAHPGSTNVPPGTLAGIDHRMDSMLNLLQRYPVMWQGQLGLKNDSTAVQMHFVAGNKDLIPGSLPQRQPDGTVAPIRIVQRMRLEQTQLEGVAKRMQNEREYSMMLAVPCGRDVMDIIQQSSFLKDGFIKYLQEKQAAGIVNVPAPGTNQTAYVVHIFPPCEFSEINVSRLAPDLLQPTRDVAYLLIIVATC